MKIFRRLNQRIDYQHIEELYALYNEDPDLYRAYIIANGSQYFFGTEYRYKKGELMYISKYRITFGVSITGKMIKTTSVLQTFMICNKGVYSIIKNKSIPAKPGEFFHFIYNTGDVSRFLSIASSIFKTYCPRLLWVVDMKKEHKPTNFMRLNNRHTNMKDWAKSFYHTNGKTALLYLQYRFESVSVDLPIAGLIKISSRKMAALKKITKNYDFPSSDFLQYMSDHSIEIADLYRFSFALGLQVNAAWSKKRLEYEHNERSKLFIKKTHRDEPLIIGSIFIDFYEKFKDKGLVLFTRTTDLVIEGLKMRHCVGTYTLAVNSQKSAIYHYKGGTLQLSEASGRLYMSQFRAFANQSIDEDLVTEVQKMLEYFNSEIATFEPQTTPLKESATC